MATEENRTLSATIALLLQLRKNNDANGLLLMPEHKHATARNRHRIPYRARTSYVLLPRVAARRVPTEASIISYARSTISSNDPVLTNIALGWVASSSRVGNCGKCQVGSSSDARCWAFGSASFTALTLQLARVVADRLHIIGGDLQQPAPILVEQADNAQRAALELTPRLSQA